MFGLIVGAVTRWINGVVGGKPAKQPTKPKSPGIIIPPKIEFPKLLPAPNKDGIIKYYSPTGKLTPQQQAANQRALTISAAESRRIQQITAENARRAKIRADKKRKFDAAISNNRSVMKTMAKNWAKLFPKQQAPRYDPSQDPTAKEGTKEYYDQVTAHYKWLAGNTLSQQKQFHDQPGAWDNIFDWFGGQTRREQGARQFAHKQVGYLATEQVSRYETMATAFQKQQGKKMQQLKDWQAQGKLTQKQLDDYKRWEEDNIKTLRYMAAATQGSLAGYDEGARAKLTTPLGQSLDWFQSNVVQGAPGKVLGGLFQYTLGSGDRDKPSLVTAPSRFINTLGNLMGNKERYYRDGSKQSDRAKSFADAWRQSYEQRNFNLAPYQKGGSKDFEAWFKSRDLRQWQADIKAGKISPDYVKQLYKRAYEGHDQGGDFANQALEFLADPLLLVGGGAAKVGRVAEAAKGLTTVQKASGFFTAAGKKLVSTKVGAQFQAAGKWLTAEAKSPKQRYFEAAERANKTIDAAQARYFPQLREYSRRYHAENAALKAKFDDSVIDEFKKLAEAGDDKAAKWLQTMRHGKFTASARIANFTRAGGVGSNPRLEKLQALADRYGEFADMQRQADQISDAATRFGRGKKRSFYSPRTKYFEELDDYDFRVFKKNLAPQSAQDLYRGVVDRYFKSDVINYWGKRQKGRVGRLDQRIQDTVTRYDEATAGVRAEVEAAYRKTRTPYGRLRAVTDKYGPMSIWKKSVLKYRPAWTVNNILYNTQAAGLAGGAGAVLRQAKYLRPGRFKREINQVPAAVRSQVVNEVGSQGDRLTRFYTRVEDIPRLAAFQELKAKGLSDAAALKRVNKYLLSYRTKNYERPLKALVPFYHFQKGVAKAAVTMPLDRPLAAKAYNEVDRFQAQQYEREFETLRPELKKYGYSDAEIEAFKAENAKYFKGRLKIGDHYYTTPFNVFSEKGLGQLGWNPYVTAASEAATATDQYGQSVAGEEASFFSRLRSKFPQLDLAKKWLDADAVAAGRVQPRNAWISTAGSLGYGMTKEQQGVDPTKANYRPSLDPRAGLSDDIGAFFGKPRGLQFDTARFLDFKKTAKIAEEYFAIPDDLDYDERTKRETALFAKFGVTASEFYDGILARNDTAFTKGVKQLRDQARLDDQALYDWYHGQPAGTKNVAATQKLRQLVRDQYFANNPFHKYRFDWMTSESVARADRQLAKLDNGGKWVKVGSRLLVKTAKQLAYERAKASGDWSGYSQRYGRRTSQKRADYQAAKASGDWTDYHRKYGKTAKQLAYERAKASGDWTVFEKTYGTSRKIDPKKRAEARFWQRYVAASLEERRQLMADHPEYDKRKDWTPAQWDEAKRQKRAKTLENTKFRAYFTAATRQVAAMVPAERSGRQRSVKYVLK